MITKSVASIKAAMITVVKVFVHIERIPIEAALKRIIKKINCFWFILYARLVIIILRSERLTRFPTVSPSYYLCLRRVIVGQSTL